MTMPAVRQHTAQGDRRDGDVIVEVLSLAELFSGVHRFRLPPFQRAYAWQTAHVGRLIADIREAMEDVPPRRQYPLGLVTLVKQPGDPIAAIIDGHQRIMTLTILFAVLRDLEIDPLVKERLATVIAKPGRGRSAAVEYVLEPQHIIAEFMAETVQKPGATLRDPGLDDTELSETERNILENRDYLCAALGDNDIDQDTRRALSVFLADNCRVIVRIMGDEIEAWRTLEIEDATRVDFNACSRSKASILSALPASVRGLCSAAWDRCEQLVGPDDMHRLLELIRMLKLRHRSQRPIDTDIWEAFDLAGDPAGFFEHELLPAARRLKSLREGSFGKGESRERIRELLDRLGWLQLDFWMPAALHWLTVRGSEAPETEAFFRALERLVWIARIANLEPPKQERRVLAILTHIDKGRPVGLIPELAIETKLRQEVLANLRSPNFRQKSYSALVLRRISAAMGRDCGPYDRQTSTFEHIVPRNPERDRGWISMFRSRKQACDHMNRLGNLTFLTRDENGRAGTAEWPYKREIYRASPHILAQSAAEREEWGPASIIERTEELIRILFGAWDLKV